MVRGSIGYVLGFAFFVFSSFDCYWLELSDKDMSLKRELRNAEQMLND